MAHFILREFGHYFPPSFCWSQSRAGQLISSLCTYVYSKVSVSENYPIHPPPLTFPDKFPVYRPASQIPEDLSPIEPSTGPSDESKSRSDTTTHESPPNSLFQSFSSANLTRGILRRRPPPKE